MATDMLTDTISSLPYDTEDEPLYEIVDGERIEVPMSAYASVIASRIAGALQTPQIREIGEAVTETLFRLKLPTDRIRRPDVALVKYDRWPKGKLQPVTENAWNVVPNLMVEVISPTDFAEDLLEKIREYFQAGAETVWAVYPRLEIVHRYWSLTDITAFNRENALTDEKVLPAFKLPLAEIFLKEE